MACIPSSSFTGFMCSIHSSVGQIVPPMPKFLELPYVYSITSHVTISIILVVNASPENLLICVGGMYLAVYGPQTFLDDSIMYLLYCPFSVKKLCHYFLLLFMNF